MKNFIFPLSLAIGTAISPQALSQTDDGAAAKPIVSVSTSSEFAYEKENIFATITVKRDSTDTELSVNFSVFGSDNISDGSASNSDYRLNYSDGTEVGSSIVFTQGQETRTIRIHAIDDGLNEVPETLKLVLDRHDTYELSGNKVVTTIIKDAQNIAENSKVFIGIFGPQGDAVTDASGTLSLILSGDNSSAVLSYDFYNLGSEQTDQHIHLSPSGTVIHDIEHFGKVKGLYWDLAPGGIFAKRQEMLDALYAGEFYLNIHTASYPAGEISAHFIYEEEITPPEESVLTPEDVDQDIIRFLTQATFGPTEASYQALRSKIALDGSNRMAVYEAWIDAQIDQSPSSLLQLTDASVAIFKPKNGLGDRRDAFWTNAIFGKDQLRQRMAFALSEILVVGDSVNTVRNAYRGTADYWDTLSENAFESYRSTLGDVSRHPIMGVWLSHLRNKKADPEAGFSPDENFAREVMQLFSFGLVQREKDGTITLGDDLLPVATYDNEVIQQMARVFTGLGFSVRNKGGEKIDNTRFHLGNGINTYQYRWTEPMKFFPQFHDYGEKILFTDQGQALTIPESFDYSVTTAEKELDQVLDALVSHSSTAPYISRLLIQRFVSSNPSANYIERVANAFGDNGDLEKVVKAILLDVEARNPSVQSSTQFGKVKEPVLRLSAVMRLLDAGSQVSLGDENQGMNLGFTHLYREGASILRVGDLGIGQHPLGSTTVFNFFSPDFSPSGELSANSLVAPELELMTESQLVSTFNIIHRLVGGSFVRGSASSNVDYTKEQLKVKISFSELERIWSTTAGDNYQKAEAIVDYLDFYLSAGQLKSLDSPTRNILIETVALAKEKWRYREAIYGLVNSPDALVQK